MKAEMNAWAPLDDDLTRVGAISLEIVFKALGDRIRLQMLRCLLFETPLCVGDFQKQLILSQPLASHHLGKLVDAGILGRSRSGRRMWYWINEGALQRLAALLVAGVEKTDTRA